MLFKCFAELGFKGPTGQPSRLGASLGHGGGQGWLRAGGHELLYFQRNSISSNHARETFAYLSFQFLLCYACHFFEANFFFFFLDGKP